jgi:UDP-N-acetylglucosamine transferase subunit ALG13
MIFVTVGSFEFDPLVQAVDEAIGRGEIQRPVTIQIGHGSYEPRHCEYFRSAPGLDAYYGSAELVVGHGGTGTTLEVIERGVRLVSVSNPALMDNHQHEFLEALERKGLTRYCRDLKDLGACIRDALSRPAPQPRDAGFFYRQVVVDLETLIASPR